MRKSFINTLAVTGLLIATGSANAETIGVNFGSERRAVGPAQSAGVIAQTNWNNASGPTAIVTDVNNGAGAATTVDVEWASRNTWKTQAANGDGNTNMMHGYLDDGNGGFSVTVSEIAYATYDVYIYLSTDMKKGAYTNTATINGGTQYYAKTHVSKYKPVTSLIQATGTTIPTPTVNANYILFTGVTGSSFTIDGAKKAGNNRSTIAGFQIVESVAIPEPASLVLLSLGGLTMLKRKK